MQFLITKFAREEQITLEMQTLEKTVVANDQKTLTEQQNMQGMTVT